METEQDMQQYKHTFLHKKKDGQYKTAPECSVLASIYISP